MKSLDLISYHCERNFYRQAFSVFGILPVTLAAAEIPAGIHFACHSRGRLRTSTCEGVRRYLIFELISEFIANVGPSKN